MSQIKRTLPIGTKVVFATTPDGCPNAGGSSRRECEIIAYNETANLYLVKANEGEGWPLKTDGGYFKQPWVIKKGIKSEKVWSVSDSEIISYELPENYNRNSDVLDRILSKHKEKFGTRMAVYGPAVLNKISSKLCANPPSIDLFLSSRQEVQFVVDLLKNYFDSWHSYGMQMYIEGVNLSSFVIKNDGCSPITLNIFSIRDTHNASHFDELFKSTLNVQFVFDRNKCFYEADGKIKNINGYDTLIKVIKSECKSLNLNISDIVSGFINLDPKKEECQMKDQVNQINKVSGIGAMVTSDFHEAKYRVAASQLTKGAKAAVCHALSTKLGKGRKKSQNVAIQEIIESEMGTAIIAEALGYALTFAPILKDHPQAGKLAKELRVQGMATAGNTLMESLTEALAPALMQALSSLGNVDDEQRVRVADSLPEKKVQVEEIGTNTEEAKEHLTL